MPPPGELLQLDALGPSGAYRTRSPMPVTDVSGMPVAALSLVPVPFVSRAMSAVTNATTMPEGQRLAALAAASSLFRTANVGGLGAAEYHRLTSRVSGLGISTVRRAADQVADACAGAYLTAQAARPRAAVSDWRDPATLGGSAVWVPRGRAFAVQAAGNQPALHCTWPEALALGYRVAIRPSRREPFTPHRLVAALRMAGFGDDQVLFLPSDYDAADEMIRGADLAMVYGGDNVMRKYAGRSDVLRQGPGRSKILLTSDVDWREYVDLIVESVSRDGGTGCTNTTTVFVEGDPTPIAQAIAEKLAAIPSLPPEDEAAILPVHATDAGRKIAAYLTTVARDATPVLGGDGIVDELGDGSAALRPAVFLLGTPDAFQSQVELSFPCVWVAPWTRQRGVQRLKGTLALTVLTSDENLVDALLAEPTIRNVYLGAYPTYWSAAGMPHDGYMADFLMELKGMVRDT